MRTAILIAATVTLLGISQSNASQPRISWPKEIEEPERYVRMALESDAIENLTDDWDLVSGVGEHMLDGIVYITLTYEREAEHSPRGVYYEWKAGVQFKGDSILNQTSLALTLASMSGMADSVESSPRVNLFLTLTGSKWARISDGQTWLFTSTSGDSLRYRHSRRWFDFFVFKSPSIVEKTGLFLPRCSSDKLMEFEEWLPVRYVKLGRGGLCVSTCDSCGGDGFWFVGAACRLPSWCEWVTFPNVFHMCKYLDKHLREGGWLEHALDNDTLSGVTILPIHNSSSPRPIYSSVKGPGDSLICASMVVSRNPNARSSRGGRKTFPLYELDSLRLHKKWPATGLPEGYTK
jgi:hypothetical protein